MWTVLSPEGAPVYWHPDWDHAVTWAMKHGGDLEVAFQEFRPDTIEIQGQIDLHGDLV